MLWPLRLSKLENCICKTQMMPPCPTPVPTHCPTPPMTLQHIQSTLKTNVWNVNFKIAVILSKTIFLSANSHMHILNRLVISVQNFKSNAWKLWEELFTQSCYPILKPFLKTVQVKNAVILSKTISSPAKCHMHILNMHIASVQSFKLIACKPYTNLLPHIQA